MAENPPSELLSRISISDNADSSNHNRQFHTSPTAQAKGKAKAKGGSNKNNTSKPNPSKSTSKPDPSKSTKLRGFDRDPPDVRISKTLSWLLRHKAQGEGLTIRPDGYIKVTEILNHPKLKSTGVDFEKLKELVRDNSKQRFDLIQETSDGRKLDSVLAAPSAAADSGSAATEAATDAKDGIWWIRARQGHSLKTVQIEMKPILTLKDIPTGIAVHGTRRDAWKIIAKEGLSKMERNHIHLAQNVAGEHVVSGMRTSSQILIYVDIEKAIDAKIKFWLSDNGVILTEGDSNGYLSTQFFQKVVDVKAGELHGWNGT